MAKQRKAVVPKVGRPQMPGYGIPETRKGLLPWKWAEQRLQKSHNYWITTVKPDGSPHVMVVWGLWLDGAFLFSTGSQSRKTRNLAKNPRCVVVPKLPRKLSSSKAWPKSSVCLSVRSSSRNTRPSTSLIWRAWRKIFCR